MAIWEVPGGPPRAILTGNLQGSVALGGLSVNVSVSSHRTAKMTLKKASRGASKSFRNGAVFCPKAPPKCTEMVSSWTLSWSRLGGYLGGQNAIQTSPETGSGTTCAELSVSEPPRRFGHVRSRRSQLVAEPTIQPAGHLLQASIRSAGCANFQCRNSCLRRVPRIKNAWSRSSNYGLVHEVRMIRIIILLGRLSYS